MIFNTVIIVSAARLLRKVVSHAVPRARMTPTSGGALRAA